MKTKPKAKTKSKSKPLHSHHCSKCGTIWLTDRIECPICDPLKVIEQVTVIEKEPLPPVDQALFDKIVTHVAQIRAGLEGLLATDVRIFRDMVAKPRGIGAGKLKKAVTDVTVIDKADLAVAARKIAVGAQPFEHDKPGEPITAEGVRALLTDYCRINGTPAGRELVFSFGVRAISELTQEQLTELERKIKESANAS